VREGKGAGRAWASAGNGTQWCIQARLWGQTRQRGARLRRPAALILPVRPTFLDPALHPPCLRPVLPTPACRFFEDYKKNENKLVVVDEFLGRKDALRIIREAMVRGPACWVLGVTCASAAVAASAAGAAVALSGSSLLPCAKSGPHGTAAGCLQR
jgi:hypothetical protein